MSVELAPQDESEIIFPGRQSRRSRSHGDNMPASEPIIQTRRPRSLSFERDAAAAARARALRLERHLRKLERRSIKYVDVPSPTEAATSKISDSGNIRTRQCSSRTHSAEAKDDLSSSLGMRGSGSTSSSHARESSFDSKERNPKATWTSRFVDIFKLRRHKSKPPYTAVVPSCAEVPIGLFKSQEGERGSRCEDTTSVRWKSERRVEHRSSKLPRSMFGSQAAWFIGAESDDSNRDQ
eukprot:TRINITY_DN25082_c0_g1_i1.p1 TRINITY_DN25082_c0_g1~~TRINITY_DN25082_c0_g1_i1.p1  ORF type:complete len:255 (-),score=12.07 TRINITY_DN25082_c0_g1_i1:413-1126(-)